MAHKNKLTLLFTASILMLSSCGETNSSSSDVNESSKTPDSSSQVKSETPSSSETKEESSSKETPISSSSQTSTSSSKEEVISSEESSSEPISSSEEVPSSSEEEPSSSEEIPSSSEEEIPSSSEETPSSSEEIPSSSEEESSSSEEVPSSSDEQPSSSEDSSSDSPSSSEEKATYTVTFNSMGGSEVPAEVVEEGSKVAKPADPTKENYIFDGWYLTDAYKKAFDFDTEIYTDYVLYAKWKNGEATPDPEPEPEPSVTYVDYWIAGTFCSWSKDGAIQMEANPNGTDLAMKLGVEIAAGECFKVTNFSDWVGYNDALSGIATSGENGNIVLKETGTYNIYLNSYYQVWVEKVSSSSAEEGESTSGGSSSSESTGEETSSESEGEQTSSESSSESTPEESSSESTEEDSTEQISIHAPSNSSLVEWYLVGEGSLWGENGWSTAGGIQLFSNPEGEDLACILNLDIAVGDTFKIYDGGAKWIGYSEVDDWDDPSNLGKNNFEESNTNFKCKVAGTYNIYLNEKNGNKNVWIAASTVTEEE